MFAYLVGEKLQALGLDVEIVTPCSEHYGAPANVVRDNVNNTADPEEWSENGLSRQHLAVRFKFSSGIVYTYDSEALHKDASKFGIEGYQTNPLFGTGLTVEETKLISSQQEGWNRCFDRNQIPELKKIVEKHFSPCI